MDGLNMEMSIERNLDKPSEKNGDLDINVQNKTENIFEKTTSKYEVEEDEEEELVKGDVNYKLKRSIIFEGESIESIYFKFSELKGNDLLRAERIAKNFLKQKKIKEPMNVPETNKVYLYSVAALASKKPIDMFQELWADDLTAITVKTQSFLLGGEDEEEEI